MRPPSFRRPVSEAPPRPAAQSAAAVSAAMPPPAAPPLAPPVSSAAAAVPPAAPAAAVPPVPPGPARPTGPARPAGPPRRHRDRGNGERPMRVVERALRSRPDGWRDRVVVVPGGHRPGKPDQLQRDRARARLPVSGPRRIVVLGCTRGAGQTTTVLLAGDMLARLREEPVAVLDLNPGRELADRAGRGDPRPLARRGGPAPGRGGAPDPGRRAGAGLQVISGSAVAERRRRRARSSTWSRPAVPADPGRPGGGLRPAHAGGRRPAHDRRPGQRRGAPTRWA